MKKHFFNPPPSAESMTWLSFGQMAACAAAFVLLFMVAVAVFVREPKEQKPQPQPVILGK